MHINCSVLQREVLAGFEGDERKERVRWNDRWNQTERCFREFLSLTLNHINQGADAEFTTTLMQHEDTRHKPFKQKAAVTPDEDTNIEGTSV